MSAINEKHSKMLKIVTSFSATWEQLEFTQFHTMSLKAFFTGSQGSATTSAKNVQCTIIDVDSFEEESTAACKGFKLDFPPGLSPHTAYPFALHAKLVLPWDYTVRNSVMTLSARSCTRFSEGDRQLCHPCQQLIRNGMLEGILR